MWPTKAQEKAIFKEACNGYGFEEVPQDIDGLYCESCMVVHKRPTKMYSNGDKHGLGKCLCRSAVVRFYNPDDQT